MTEHWFYRTNKCSECWTAKATREITDGTNKESVCEACAIRKGFEPIESLENVLKRLNK